MAVVVNVKDCSTTCAVRKAFSLCCRNCKYYKNGCEKIVEKYNRSHTDKIKTPSELRFK